MRANGRRLFAPLLLVLFTAVGCEGDNLFESPGSGGGGGSTGSIEGQVTAAGTGIGSVSIILVGEDSTQTNSDGIYTFPDLAEGVYSLQLRVPPNFDLAAGQESLRSGVQVAAGRTTSVDWELTQQVNVGG